MCIIYNTEIIKNTYRHDVDYQVSRLQDYHVKPIQIDKTDRLGGYYSVDLYYGNISDKELDSVILDLYNDGFIEYSDKHNKKFHKNQKASDIKSHHYIISYDPADVTKCGLTGEKAQALSLALAKKIFPGYQALIVTHTDGHNKSGDNRNNHLGAKDLYNSRSWHSF